MFISGVIRNKRMGRTVTGVLCCCLIFCMLFSSCGTGEVERFTMPVMDGESVGASAEPTENPDTEVRGVWIASVYNINYPSKAGLGAKELASELDDIIATALDTGLNAIYFQVRPSGDALYHSDIFPVSEFISGERGKECDDGFDALAYLVKHAHAKGIKVHAWVNPLRVTVGSASAPLTDVNDLPENDPARKNPELCVAYADGRLYYDPGMPEARELIAAGCREIAENYAVDGIIFDDYFYPSPVYTEKNGAQVLAEFDDSASYKKYGNGTELDDWRRENVNKMVKLCYDEIKAVRDNCLFGIAPFGIWQNDNGVNGGSDTAGMESYSSIYCDSLAFVEGGYIDYIAPQIYWSFSTSVARYDTLVRWWNSKVQNTGVDLLICHGVYRYEDMDEPDEEILRQIQFARSELAYKGSIHYGYASIKNNTKGLADELKTAYSAKMIYDAPRDNGGTFVISTPQSGTYTEESSTYLIGSANTADTVIFNGEKVSLTKSGCFSVHTELQLGKNVITITCNGKEYEHIIYRTEPSVGGYTVMDRFEVRSVSPHMRTTVQSGNILELSCTAPAGSVVTAEVGGKTVTLLPVLGNVGSEPFIAELYRGTMELDTADSIESLGKVVFTAERGEYGASCEGGEIRVLGKGYCIPVTVKNDYAHLKVSPESSFYDDYTPQVVGMTEYAVGEEEGYWLLSMGGYISVDDTEASEAVAYPTRGGLRQMLQTTDGKHTVFYIKSPEKPAISAELNGTSLIFTLHNVQVTDTTLTRDTSSPVVENAALAYNGETGNSEVRLTLLDEKNFYGFEFGYEQVQGVPIIRISLNEPPTLKQGDKPLEGKRIVLDAGHGGDDPGALGAFGAESGKNEADINLAIVLKLREKLAALGAEVILTRDSDITLELEDREKMLLELDPDLVMVVHQNSMPYSADITKIRGIAAFYCADSGKLLADAVSDELSAALGRDYYEPRWLTLMMCRNHRFVSALVETGFMTSVEEYERMLTREGVETTAEGIKNGILEFYSRASDF